MVMAKGMVTGEDDEEEEEEEGGGLIKLFLLDLSMLRAEPARNHFS